MEKLKDISRLIGYYNTIKNEEVSWQVYLDSDVKERAKKEQLLRIEAQLANLGVKL